MYVGDGQGDLTGIAVAIVVTVILLLALLLGLCFYREFHNYRPGKQILQYSESLISSILRRKLTGRTFMWNGQKGMLLVVLYGFFLYQMFTL